MIFTLLTHNQNSCATPRRAVNWLIQVSYFISLIKSGTREVARAWWNGSTIS